MTTPTQRPPLKERSPWLWGCQTVFLSFVALCVLIIIVVILYKKFDGFRLYHGEVEIVPYVETYIGGKNDTLQGYYHLYCYRKVIDTEKHNLKKILAFFQDTTIKKTVLNKAVELHKHKTDYNRESNIFLFEKRDYYGASFITSDPTYFESFSTFAAPNGSYLRVPTDFKRKTVGNDYIITFQYDVFNVEGWQKFINIMEFDQRQCEDTIDRIYKLKNPQTDSIECIIETKRFDKRIGFKMEIL